MTDMQKLADSMFLSVKTWSTKEFGRLIDSAIEPIRKRFDDLPVPKDGKDGQNGADGVDGVDGKSVTVEDVQPIILQEVGKAIAAIPAPVNGVDGEKGQDGTSVSIEDVQPLIVSEIQKAVASIPAPKDGEPGQDGKSVTAGDLIPLVADLVSKAVAEIPKPTDGLNGKDGERGADGKSVSMEEIRSMLDEIVSKHVGEAVIKAVSEIPKPQDGKDADGEAIKASILAEVMKAFNEIPRPLDGREGLKGDPGRDAIQIMPLSTIDTERTYPRGTYASFKGGLWHSVKTTAGEDGWECLVDGIDIIDCMQDPDDPRKIGVGIKTSKGRYVVKEFNVPFIIDKGVFKEGTGYKAGDGVTWARHYWVATKDTDQKPDYGGDWRLTVKGGRDGREGRDGIDRTQAVKV